MTIYFLQGASRRLAVVAGPLLGTGRVAAVYAINEPANATSLVLKLFHEDVPAETIDLVDLVGERRLDQLVPAGVPEEQAFPLLACPKCLVYADEESTKPIGLGVLRTDTDRFQPLHAWLVSSKVQDDLRFCVTAATRLCEVVEAVHAADFVVGDLSGSNVLLDGEGFCNLLDIDSFGVVSPDGDLVIRPGFATTNFFAPEVAVAGPSVLSDRFALGMIITQLLLGGMHPFGGSHRSGERDTVQANIMAGESWLFSPDSFTLPADSGTHLSVRCLPNWMHDPVRRALVGPAGQRPSASDWRFLLLRAHSQIVTCESCSADRFRGAVCRRCGDGAGTVRASVAAATSSGRRVVLGAAVVLLLVAILAVVL